MDLKVRLPKRHVTRGLHYALPVATALWVLALSLVWILGPIGLLAVATAVAVSLVLIARD
jgi:hypothetical protein